VVVAQAEARTGRQSLLGGDTGFQQLAQRGRSQRFVGQRLLELQVQPRHVDAARGAVAQVDRDVHACRHMQGLAALARQADRQRHRVHADPVQRARERGGVEGDVGQRGMAGRVVHRRIVPARR
jgi:hypothetical protein